jgi:hypothetical protein
VPNTGFFLDIMLKRQSHNVSSTICYVVEAVNMSSVYDELAKRLGVYPPLPPDGGAANYPIIRKKFPNGWVVSLTGSAQHTNHYVIVNTLFQSTDNLTVVMKTEDWGDVHDPISTGVAELDAKFRITSSDPERFKSFATSASVKLLLLKLSSVMLTLNRADGEVRELKNKASGQLHQDIFDDMETLFDLFPAMLDFLAESVVASQSRKMPAMEQADSPVEASLPETVAAKSTTNGGGTDVVSA